MTSFLQWLYDSGSGSSSESDELSDDESHSDQNKSNHLTEEIETAGISSSEDMDTEFEYASDEAMDLVGDILEPEKSSEGTHMHEDIHTYLHFNKNKYFIHCIPIHALSACICLLNGVIM